MAQADYHYIKNYSNFGKIGISYEAIRDVMKETLKDVENILITKVGCEVDKEQGFIANVAIKVNYGLNINDITTIIQDKVESALINMCEIANPKVNVKIDGIIVK
jgi:uncharacterized alkaline shock family protein YloU